ncbi:MAG: hypothetical protein ACE3JP_17045 [Ectobacillus sp.]
MEGLFSYVFSYVFLMLIVMGALLLFPFFPMLAMFLAVLCMFGIAIVFSCLPDKENSPIGEPTKAKTEA